MAAHINKIPLKVLDNIITRSPIYPFNFQSDIEQIAQLLDDDFFLEAIYIASPLLYEECLKLKSGEVKSEKDRSKLINSLYRYYTRMYTRSTPFGLFSTCDVAEWGDGNQVGVTREYSRHTRLDMHFLQTMVAVISQITYVSELLLYHANNTAYLSGTEMRYIEHSYLNNKRKYKISAVNNNRYILQVLEAAKKGISKKEMVDMVVKEGITQADAEDFIGNLIESQLLISEFEVAITGKEDFAFQILGHLQVIYERSGSWYIQSILNFFKTIVNELQVLDNNKSNKVEAYKNIIAKLKQLQPVIDEGKTFHIDSYRIGQTPLTIRESAKDEILELVDYLAQLNEGFFVVNNNLEEFKAKFMNRYEHQAVGLAEVLDTDIGIGYPINRKVSSAPIVDDIPLPNKEGGSTQIQMSVIEKWLSDLFTNPTNANAYCIDLSKQPQHRLFKKISANNNKWKSAPLSFSFMFRVLNDEQQSILFETIMGPSAASILARFTYGNPTIKNVMENIVEEEMQMVENAILAEIVHLPDNRVTNVIMHPPVRNFEIPYLAAPTVTKDHTIELADLYIKCENNEIILFSKRLNKRILPRKTHMHNHVTNSLPLYHFLADLQDQGSNSSFAIFGTELLKAFIFFPRLYYKTTIISPAMWNFGESITEQLKNINEGDDSFIHELRVKYRIPQRVLHVDGDNDLLVDFDNPGSVQIWLNLVKARPTVLLKEFLYQEDPSNNTFMHQYIASIVCTEKKVYGDPIPFGSLNNQGETPRQFLLGSEWLYLKLYCGIGSVDTVLTKMVSPLMKQLMQQGVLHKWFFVKYFDTDYHIRLRLHLKNSADMHLVLSIFNDHMLQSPDKQLVWKIQPDVYTREIERYGADTIDICEYLFFVDSLTAVEMPSYIPTAQHDKMFFLWGMKMVDDMLLALQLTTAEKIDFIDSIRKGYQYEFNANKDTNEGINKKYNSLKVEMAAILGNEATAVNAYKKMYLLVQQKAAMQSVALADLAKRKQESKLTINFYGLLSSLIHMMLNRIISNKERLHEFLAYEFLLKYYRMMSFKEKQVDG